MCSVLKHTSIAKIKNALSHISAIEYAFILQCLFKQSDVIILTFRRSLLCRNKLHNFSCYISAAGITVLCFSSVCPCDYLDSAFRQANIAAEQCPLLESTSFYLGHKTRINSHTIFYLQLQVMGQLSNIQQDCLLLRLLSAAIHNVLPFQSTFRYSL